MQEFLDFLSYSGGLIIGTLVLGTILLILGILVFLLIFRLLFGESLNAVVKRRNAELEDEDEYP